MACLFTQDEAKDGVYIHISQEQISVFYISYNAQFDDLMTAKEVSNKVLLHTESRESVCGKYDVSSLCQILMSKKNNVCKHDKDELSELLYLSDDGVMKFSG